MLTMMTGMVPAHSGGTGVGLDENTTKLLLSELDAHRSELEKLRMHLKETIENSGSNPKLDAELKRLTMELARNKVQQDKLRTQLQSTPTNTGKLTEKELQKRLDEEKTRRAALEIELKDKQSDLHHTKEKLSDAKAQIKVNARDLAASRRDLSKTRDALAKTSEALVDMTRTHVDTQRKLAKAESEIESGKSEIKRRDEEIKRQSAELKISAARLSSAQGENRSMQSKLAYTTGQLRVRERDYAGLQDQLSRAQGELMVEKLSAAEMRARSEELGKTLKTAVTQLSATSAELKRTTQDKTIAETKLASIQKITNELIQQSARKRSDVIANYGNSVINLNCRISEEKIFGVHTGSGSFFLPVVDFNGRKLIVGTLNKFAGDSNTALNFNKVKEVLFTAQSPGPKSIQKRIASPILLLPSEVRAAAFEYSDSDRKALPLLTFNALQERGLDGLYLFKCTSLGRESAVLDGRCSLSMVPGETQMFIRNAGRANNELRAEPGDFILSREGQFVGIVVDHDQNDSGRVRGVRAALFADGKAWDNAETIPTIKKPGSTYYNDFAQKMNDLRRKIPADSRRR